MTLSRRQHLEAAAIAAIGVPLIEALGGTYNWREHGANHFDDVIKAGRQPILALWHGRILSATLYFRDPQTFQEIGRVDVYDRNGPVVNLNELEYVNGEIYANIWQTDRIARISPQTGQVLGWIDLTGLLSPEERQPPVDVLNGIAYDSASDRLFVTGKRWPKLFEIDVVSP